MNNFSKPLVSIIMPVYNAEDYLPQAIESILNQTYGNFELIIIDDASTDNSWQIINSYQKKFPKKILSIRSQKTLNKGGDACANMGLKKARGKYIARMDADDISLPQRLEKQVSFLEKNKDVFLVGSNATVINKTGKKIGEKLEPLTSDQIYRSYVTFHPLIHPTCLWRKKIRNKLFKYDIKFSANNDYYTFFKLLCLGYKFVNMKEKLIKYRIHDKNDTFKNMRQKFINTLVIRLIMVFNFGYNFKIKDIFISGLQLVMVLLLPPIILKELYLATKGIVNPFKSIREHISFGQIYPLITFRFK